MTKTRASSLGFSGRSEIMFLWFMYKNHKMTLAKISGDGCVGRLRGELVLILNGNQYISVSFTVFIQMDASSFTPIRQCNVVETFVGVGTQCCDFC
jgi:hypothetical protein